MKRIQAIAFAFTLTMTIAMLSCNDPLQIGTELLVDGDIDFVSTDTITVEGLTTQLDSTIAYRPPNFIFTNHKLGWVNDPIFGSHRSELFIQILPENFLKPEGQVDSVILAIPYDSLDIYGNQDATFGFEMYGLLDNISRLGTYYTDDVLQPFSPIGEVNGYSSINSDSIEIVEINSTGGLDTLNVPTQLRIKLNNDFGDLLLGLDSVAYTAVDTFLNEFNGILIRPKAINGAMLPLATSNTSTSRNNKVSVYYQNSDGDPRQFDYFIGGATFSLHNHDYSTGTIEGSIDNSVLSKDLLYLQGAGGPSIKVKLPYIQSLTDVVVNEAILELTTELLPQDDRNKYRLPPQLYTTYKRDSLMVLVSDIGTAIQGFRDEGLAGGRPIEVTSGNLTSIVYRFNLSDHIQGMINGSVSNELFIQLSDNSTGVERIVFKGINDSESPIKLKITYTEI